jgi:type IV pilus assembly protein PilV
MLKTRFHRHESEHGTSLLEVLITIVILAFGLLGLAGLQSKIQLAEFEAYQRAHAVLLLSDMHERINANRLKADEYVSASVFGTSYVPAAPCTSLAAGSARDQCEWSEALQGASELRAAARVGAMAGARGCITQVQAPDPTPGVCKPGIYLVAVAWQGLLRTVTPTITCGQALYGADDAYRRVISAQVSVGVPSCL